MYAHYIIIQITRGNNSIISRAQNTPTFQLNDIFDWNTSVVVVLVVGAYQHCSHESFLYSNPPMEFRHSSPDALHTKLRERPLLAKDGTKAKEFS
jgi:hypothetical protein